MIFKERNLIMEQFGIIMLIKRERRDIQVVQAKLGVKMVKWFLARLSIQLIQEEIPTK